MGDIFRDQKINDFTLDKGIYRTLDRPTLPPIVRFAKKLFLKALTKSRGILPSRTNL